jgi:hypothetical protein
MNPLRGGVVVLAGLVGAGVLAWPSVASATDDPYVKRDEQDADLVLVADDEDPDDDPDGVTDTGNTRNTGVSRVTRDDATDISRVTRDVTRDVSRDDTRTR